MLGLRFCARAFSSCGKRGPLFLAVRGPLTIAASLVAEHRLQNAGSVVVAHGPRCSAACGIFPEQGSNPCPRHWQADSQPLRHQGSPGKQFLKNRGGESSRFVFSWNLPVRTDDAFGYNMLQVSSSGTFLPRLKAFGILLQLILLRGFSSHTFLHWMLVLKGERLCLKCPLRTDLLRIRPVRTASPCSIFPHSPPSFWGLHPSCSSVCLKLEEGLASFSRLGSSSEGPWLFLEMACGITWILRV